MSDERVWMIIVCDEPSHEGKVVIVETFGESNVGLRQWKDSKEPSTAALVDDAPVAAPAEGAEPTAVRLRINLTCEVCGLSLVRRHEVVMPYLGKLAAHGVSRVRLSALARTLP